MKKRKLFFILFILIILGILVYFIFKNISVSKISNDEFSDYTPEQEISDTQLRETSITLYFLNKQTNELDSEKRFVDSAELVANPYKFIVQELINGPQNENFSSLFPENTLILDASINSGCVTLNFSEELLNFQDETQKYNIINSILNSLVQLNEVTSIKFLINGETVDALNEEYCEIS